VFRQKYVVDICLGEKVSGTFIPSVPEDRRAASLSPASDHPDRQALILRDLSCQQLFFSPGWVLRFFASPPEARQTYSSSIEFA